MLDQFLDSKGSWREVSERLREQDRSKFCPSCHSILSFFSAYYSNIYSDEVRKKVGIGR